MRDEDGTGPAADDRSTETDGGDDGSSADASTEEPGSEDDVEADHEYDDVPDGCGCAEFWEYASDRRRTD